MGFVGIQTGFGSVGRRRSLRQTWMPSDPQSLQRSVYPFFFFLTIYLFNSVLNLKKWLCRLEEATGLTFRFVIGKTNDKSKMLELKKEVAEYDDFLLLDIEEEYSKLPYKTYVAALSAHNKYIFCF